jgi:rhodanese-related sulfurtransferase
MESRVRRFLTALLGAALLCAAAPARGQDAPMEIKGARTLNADGVIELIRTTGNVVIVDSRSAADYDAGHIEGAVRLIDTDMTGEAVLARHVKAKSTPVLFYCNGLKCGRAAKAAAKAVEWGYTNVHYYALGLTEWRQRKLPLVR